ncbi:MAG: exodeoxyribonuclease III [Alphaproteobacteria bacterium]|nr:exodeoxyribonuclease III [Alphaproteobacteria bacterium]
MTTQLKIASFNVNSVKARLPRVLEWLKNSNPDVVLLQELKCVEDEFPREAFYDVGYNAAVFGQKTYNGVAILSKYKIEDVVKGLPTLLGDEQSRYIEGVISVAGKAIRVASIYVPNGGSEEISLETSQKFLYKLDFYDRLKAHISKLLDFDEIQIFGGDFNVAVDPIDVYDPKTFEGQILFHPLERQKFRSLLNLGLIDSYRITHPNDQAFSWWDYRSGAWQHNKGARIDYLLTSPLAADHITSASIEDKGVRDQEKASDHCPVCVTLEI